MNERQKLYDEMCVLLTDYEGNDSESIPTAEDFYAFLVKLQVSWESLSDENNR